MNILILYFRKQLSLHNDIVAKSVGKNVATHIKLFYTQADISNWVIGNFLQFLST